MKKLENFINEVQQKHKDSNIWDKSEKNITKQLDVNEISYIIKQFLSEKKSDKFLSNIYDGVIYTPKYEVGWDDGKGYITDSKVYDDPEKAIEEFNDLCTKMKVVQLRWFASESIENIKKRHPENYLFFLNSDERNNSSKYHRSDFYDIIAEYDSSKGLWYNECYDYWK